MVTFDLYEDLLRLLTEQLRKGKNIALFIQFKFYNFKPSYLQDNFG